MGLIEQEIMELRDLAKKIAQGQIGDSTASLLLGVYNQTSKRVTQMIQIQSLAVKEGKSGKSYKNIVASNLISDGAAISIDSTEEKIKCAAKGGVLVNRETCLDYSGEEQHIDFCQECEHFSTTRKQFNSTEPV